MSKSTLNVKVIGVGGGGCNAVRLMIGAPIPGVEYLVCDTRCGLPALIHR